MCQKLSKTKRYASLCLILQHLWEFFKSNCLNFLDSDIVSAT